jgi:hypothetical protein
VYNYSGSTPGAQKRACDDFPLRHNECLWDYSPNSYTYLSLIEGTDKPLRIFDILIFGCVLILLKFRGN